MLVQREETGFTPTEDMLVQREGTGFTPTEDMLVQREETGTTQMGHTRAESHERLYMSRVMEN